MRSGRLAGRGGAASPGCSCSPARVRRRAGVGGEGRVEGRPPAPRRRAPWGRCGPRGRGTRRARRRSRAPAPRCVKVDPDPPAQLVVDGRHDPPPRPRRRAPARARPGARGRPPTAKRAAATAGVARPGAHAATRSTQQTSGQRRSARAAIQSPTGEPPSPIANARCAWRHFTCAGSPRARDAVAAVQRPVAGVRGGERPRHLRVVLEHPHAARRLQAADGLGQRAAGQPVARREGRPRRSRGGLRTTAGAPCGQRTATRKSGERGRARGAPRRRRGQKRPVSHPSRPPSSLRLRRRLRVEVAAHHERPLARLDQPQLARPRLQHGRLAEVGDLGAQRVARCARARASRACSSRSVARWSRYPETGPM